MFQKSKNPKFEKDIFPWISPILQISKVWIFGCLEPYIFIISTFVTLEFVILGTLYFGILGSWELSVLGCFDDWQFGL